MAITSTWGGLSPQQIIDHLTSDLLLAASFDPVRKYLRNSSRISRPDPQFTDLMRPASHCRFWISGLVAILRLIPRSTTHH